MPEPTTLETKFLENLWDDREAATLSADPLELLRYRSNLLGADLRITNFGGGNTSSKIELNDPLTGKPVRVLAVKGSGGDLRSASRSGFALLFLDKLERLTVQYRGEAHEDEMAALYPLCAFGDNLVAPSIDTPLHAFLPFDHVDHLHPDWAIALAASANGRRRLEEFNAAFGLRFIWIPWQRPGFELALMLRRAVAANPGCNGLVLGSHGLFTWGHSQRDCYLNSVKAIDQMGQFVEQHKRRSGRPPFGGAAIANCVDRETVVANILPHLRGGVSSNRRVIAHYDASEDSLSFAGSAWAAHLCRLGTSCPDHFVRTRICPMFVRWDPAGEDWALLRDRIDVALAKYREEYALYYRSFARADSPPLRDTNPSVVVIPGLGVLGFGQDKREARIVTEFFGNAIRVMAGANALGGDGTPDASSERVEPLPQARRADQAADFQSFQNYVALPRSEAFRIEYWALEEAKLRRTPAEREFSRKIALVVGGGSGIGREVALEVVRRGGHVVVADQDLSSAQATWADARALSSADMGFACALDLASRDSIVAALRAAVLHFGGIDIVINTAAIYPTPDPAASPSDLVWSRALHVNVTGNYVLAEEAANVLRAQRLPVTMVLTSSANAVVPKQGSEPYDVSKAAINHLIRELAIGLGPLVRVNGIAPATVVTGSSMFPRDRVIVALRKYGLAFADSESTETLRSRLADFYGGRTITGQPILPSDCAQAICWLAGDMSAKTTGHVIPVDGGLPEAFLR